MLDGIGAGADGVLHARRPAEWIATFSGRVRRLHDRLHLLEGERLRRLDAVEAAARRVDLDPVGSGLHARVDLACDRVRRRAAAAACRDAAACNEHTRADQRAGGDAVTHEDVGAASGAKVANRRDAGFQRLPRVLGGGIGRFFRRAPPALLQRRGPRRSVPVIRDVRVQIDQSRQRGVTTEVNLRRSLRHVHLRANRDDTLALITTEALGITRSPSQRLRKRSTIVLSWDVESMVSKVANTRNGNKRIRLNVEKPRDRVRGFRRHVCIGGEVVRAAREQHQLSARNDRRQYSPSSARTARFVGMDHEGGDSDLPEQVPSVPSAMQRLVIASGGLGRGRHSLEFVEVRIKRGSASLRKNWLVRPGGTPACHVPTFSHQRQQRLVFFGVVPRDAPARRGCTHRRGIRCVTRPGCWRA